MHQEKKMSRECTSPTSELAWHGSIITRKLLYIILAVLIERDGQGRANQRGLQGRRNALGTPDPVQVAVRAPGCMSDRSAAGL